MCCGDGTTLKKTRIPTLSCSWAYQSIEVDDKKSRSITDHHPSYYSFGELGFIDDSYLINANLDR